MNENMHLCFMMTWIRRVQEWPRLLWAMEFTVIFVASACEVDHKKRKNKVPEDSRVKAAKIERS